MRNFLLRNYLIVLIALVASSTKLHSQEVKTGLKFRHYNTKQGLSQGSVVEIFQDNTGYIWFGTREGLNKFDGTKFKVFRYNSEEATSISDSWVTAIFQDRSNQIWVGTKKGLNKFNSSTNNFYPSEEWTDDDRLKKVIVWGITQVNDSLMFISTSSGLCALNLKTKKTHFYTDKNNNSLTNNNTRSVFNEKNKTLWICTIDKIEKFEIEKNKWTHYEYPLGTNQNSSRTNSPKIFIDSQDKIWLGYKNGLAYLDKASNSFKNYTSANNNKIMDEVRTICEDDFNNIWIGTYTGLIILNAKSNTLQKIVHDANNPTSLSQNSIYKIFKDKKGDLWIGTWAGGINYYDYNYDSFKNISAGPTNSMLNYKVISSIVEGKNGLLWIGTEGGGINLYNKQTQKFTYFTHNNDDKNSLSSNNIKSMIKDHNQNIWIGTHDGGLNFLNTAKKPYRFEHITDNTEESKGHKRILCILEDKNHNLWIGTLTSGLLHYNVTKQHFTKLNYNLKSINSIYQSSNLDYIYTVGSDGLEKVHVDTKVITKIPLITQKEKELININCIYQQGNKLWLGTEGEGLFSYNTDTKSLGKFGIKEGLNNEVVYGILPDNNDNLWFSTNGGISRLNLTTKQIKNFDESDGLQGNEFNYGSYTKTENGVLYFGGTNGLNYFSPTEITENKFIPDVDIYNMNVSNKPYKIITKEDKIITIAYNQNDFSFDFAALNFSQANKNQYAYKLDGFDKDWNFIGNQKKATYTNIDEGMYTFKVKASNNDNYWNENGASVKIKIEPAPWKTIWAYILYCISFTLLIYLIVKLLKTRAKEKNELKEEKLNRERLEEVNLLKLKLFTNISHDFRTPLTLIIGPLERMIEKKMGNEFIQKQHATMERNANMLLQLINQLLDFRKSESGKLVLQASHSNIVDFVEEVKLSFEDLADLKQIKYTFSSPHDNIPLWFDNIKMKKILFNLLSNAFKYTAKGKEVKIRIELNETQLFIKITNYGEEISQKDIKHVFDRYYRSDQDELKVGTGIGLALTQNLVKLHKGNISVTSSDKKGTCFTVELPLGDAHLSNSEKSNLVNPSSGGEKLNTTIEETQTTESIDEEFDESKSTLLLVEDNFDVRTFLKEIFISKYNIFEAENGMQALKIADSKNINLVISDIMMPVMDGFEFCKKIKTNINTSHIPIILLTAKTDSAHLKDGYEFGADLYITKPFDSNLLEKRVDNLLNTHTNLINKFKKDIILTPKELTITSTDEVFLEKAINIIEENITDPEFNVHSFTNQMNMSRSVLYRKIKALTNQSITEFIRTIKLKKAGQLIIGTQMHISEIAYEVGFSDLKYFRKCFKNQFNELPSNYRNKHRPKDD